MAVNPVPEGYHTITPYLVVRGVAELVQFLKDAFGAEEKERIGLEDGTVNHAEVRIGDSMLMMGEARGEYAPRPAMLYLYVPDTDAAWRRAVAAGGTSILEPCNQFYGDRNAAVRDAWDNEWWIGSRVEEVPPDELKRRAREAMKSRG